MNVVLDINKIKKGMILGEDIYDNGGRFLLPKETKISEEIIKILIHKSYKKHILIKANEHSIVIEPMVQSENGEKQNVPHYEISMRDIKEQVIVREKFKEMENSVKDNFDKLSRHNTGPEVRKELENTVSEIKNNLVVNTALLNEILDIKSIDEYLYNHSLNVSVISSIIGKWLSLKGADLDNLILAGLLHDIGKIRIDPQILHKPGALTENEFSEMKKHPLHSHRMLAELGYKNLEIIRAVTLHHEKEDGTGYPLGITGEKIPLYAKILSVADIFDAMTSNRVYKDRVSPFKVLEMFQNQTFGKLDYRIVSTFVKKFLEYYVGSEVLLSNDKKAKIISLNIYEITKPLVITFEGEFLDISKKREIKILDFSEHSYT